MNAAPATSDVDSSAAAPRDDSVRFPELLAPAGDWDCVRAAVENGADAIYFGLEKFNARMRARNFTEADLPKLLEFLHRRGVKGYVTFNTLVFENELDEAHRHLHAIIAAGVDAAIVQDVGVCRLIRRLSPDFPIHASTQMTITSAGGMEFARELGCSLVVLARECSLKEIEQIRAACGVNASEASDPEALLPIEVFVHGALCVAYSGQCLTSEALGGRSANRGECAQACRMPYELIADGKPVPLGDRRYLLSPQDLAGLEVLPDLIRAGVTSLKIEGRLKSPEYVANITRIYRRAIDALGRGANLKSEASDSKYDMEMAFSRGLYTGWFRGINNQELVHARFGKKRGVYLGEVSGIQGGRVAIALKAPLKRGDGVVFDAGHPDQKEEGGRVYGIVKMKPDSPDTRHHRVGGGLEKEHQPGRTEDRVLLSFGREDLDLSRIHVGDKLWKTSDPELDRRLRQTFDGNRPQFQRPISIEVHGRSGQRLRLVARDDAGHAVHVESNVALARAEKRPLSDEHLCEHLGRLGGTPFRLGRLTNFLEGEVMLPVSELNRLRREAASQLDNLRIQPIRWAINPTECETDEYGSKNSQSSRLIGTPLPVPELIVLVRSLPQLEAALRCDARTVYCEFADPKKYREAVTLFRAAHGPSSSGSGNPCSPLPDGSQAPPPALFVAPPRIFKSGEEWILKQVRSCDADGYLVRNYDHLKFFSGSRQIGDFSLNVANSLAADYFLHHYGLERLTASYDLNIEQLEALLKSSPPEWFEITIHQHMPMFHMEHCVFCAFLSAGTDYTNCGRPCDKHSVSLKDRVGAEHPLAADIACRNTVFNSRAQTGAELVTRLLSLGARKFRIEFVNETPDQIVQTIATYRRLLRGEIAGTDVWRELKLLNQLGVTRGPRR